MANYYGQTRSNYFRVRSASAFRRFCRSYGLTVFNNTERGKQRCFGFLADEPIPTGRSNAKGDWIESDFLAELAKHLVRGEVAVVMEVGSEKMRYLIGYAGAVNWQGKRIEVSLTEIYRRAKQTFGIEPTVAEY